MSLITDNEHYTLKTIKRVFTYMKDSDLKLHLLRESNKCMNANYFIRYITGIYIEFETFYETSKEYDKLFLVNKMAECLKLKDRLFKIIKSYKLYGSYEMYTNHFDEWKKLYFSESKTILDRSHLKIIR